MIRVLNIISDTNIGGAGRVILNYLRYTDRSQFETLVAVPRGSLLKAPLEEAGAQVLEVDGMADRSYHKEDVKTLKALIQQVNPHLFTPTGPCPGASPPSSVKCRWYTADTPPSPSRPS